MKPLNELEARLSELEAAIEETKQRLPAHSVKPPVMMDLLDLEDQYEAWQELIRDNASFTNPRIKLTTTDIMIILKTIKSATTI